MQSVAWFDFVRQHPEAHLVSAIVKPPRSTSHLMRLRNKLCQLIQDQRPAKDFSAAIVREEGILEIDCGFADKADADSLARAMKARVANPRTGWSTHRSFALSADKEVALAGLVQAAHETGAPAEKARSV